ncbi:MAG: hypothetical protein JWM19_1001 [Actinomycetia bacterium]|nr:hypothetical protein [Actinomycetes bacterium]
MAVTDRPAWGADVPISMPVPAAEAVMVPMYGFGMTQYRLVPDMTAAEYESLSVPVFAPEAPAGDVVAGDAALDARSGHA